jgi:hypothetical protein
MSTYEMPADLRLRLPTSTVVADLTGSPKQIKWAESIRAKRMPEAQPDLLPILNAVADSTWWIRNQQKDWAEFNWEFLAKGTSAPSTTEMQKQTQSETTIKLEWKQINDRNHVALLFSWMTVQVFRHGMGGWRWSALGAISTGTFVSPDDAKIAVEQFVRTQFTEALKRL